jgi:hypothetical protein
MIVREGCVKRKEKHPTYPYGGTCEQISKAYVERIAGKVH